MANQMHMAETETSQEVNVTLLGRLKDFNLGNPEGIPSVLKDASPEELNNFGEKAKQCLDVIKDPEHLGCIDGRSINCNADGSQAELRQRHVSGTGSHVDIALNGEASFLDVLPKGYQISDAITLTEETTLRTTGIKPSAHKGGCGGANGATDDNESIAEKPEIIAATEAVISIPEILNFTGLAFAPDLGDRVRTNAKETAAFQKTSDWQGSRYVASVEKREPAGVEDLEVNDNKFKGHKEAAIVIIVSHNRAWSETKQKELALPDVFVWSINSSLSLAHAFAGQRGIEGAQQVLIADVAKHLATSDRLASPDTPIYIIEDY